MVRSPAARPDGRQTPHVELARQVFAAPGGTSTARAARARLGPGLTHRHGAQVTPALLTTGWTAASHDLQAGEQ